MIGELLIRDDHGARIPLPERRRRARNLICVLAHRDWAVPARTLKELLWPPPHDRDYTSALTTAVHRARELVPDRIVTESDGAGGQRYRFLRLPGDSVDVDRFTEVAALAEQARRAGETERAAGFFDDAVRIWRDTGPGGPPLPDLPDAAPMREFRELLVVKRQQCFESLAELELALGRHGTDLAQRIRAFLEFEPANDHLHAMRMLALYRAGRRSEALRAFKEATEMIEEELEVPPGGALRRMRDRIRDEDPELRWVPPRSQGHSQNLEYGRMATVNGVYAITLEMKDNYAPDREFVERMVRESGTDAPEVAVENRECLARMVRFLVAKVGVTQILDVGSGMPVSGPRVGVRNIHEVAQQTTSEARVLYVDNDPTVEAHTNAMMADGRNVRFWKADLQDVDLVLHEARSHLDFREPVVLLFGNVLQYVGDGDPDLGTDAVVGTVRRYVESVPAGSYLALTHLSGDDLHPVFRPELDATVPGATLPMYLRTAEQIERLFLGLPLLDPGLVDVGRWRPDSPFTPRPMRILGAIAAKE